MPKQPQRARETIAKDRRANVADVHWLGDVRRTEINDDGARLFRLLDKGMSGAGSACALWRVKSARCTGNHQISDRDRDAQEATRSRPRAIPGGRPPANGPGAIDESRV